MKFSSSSIFKLINRNYSPKIDYIKGDMGLKSSPYKVDLRGVSIKGSDKSLPNLIFFVDWFDKVENWIPFFTQKRQDILELRNVYIINERNFGRSDNNSPNSDQFSQMEYYGKDLERFMYRNSISTACVGGHGLGARAALLGSIYKPQNITSYFALNYSPLNYNYFSFGSELKQLVKELGQLNLAKVSRKEFLDTVRNVTKSEHFIGLLDQNLKFDKTKGFYLDFNIDHLKDKVEKYLNWSP